jgi:hypothetical protein
MEYGKNKCLTLMTKTFCSKSPQALPRLGNDIDKKTIRISRQTDCQLAIGCQHAG